MKLNKEINVLLESIKSFLDLENDFNQNIFKGVNWQKFEKALYYHSIRPIFLEQIKKQKIKIPADLLERLEEFSLSQAMVHLSNQMEVVEIQKEFVSNHIQSEAFKGISYQNVLYDNGLREAGDIDLLISKSDLKASFILLLEKGYNFTYGQSAINFDELINSLLNDNNNYEMAFKKGLNHIDLHWEIRYGFLPYKFPIDFILTLENERERIFWTMLNHHGAKEFWLKLKNIVDFELFINKFGQEMDWPSFLEQCQIYGTKTVLLNGFYLCKYFFDTKLPIEIEKAMEKHKYDSFSNSLKYMNIAEGWEKPIPRIHYEKILISSQDEGFNKWEYFRKFYNSYIVPNQIEPKRFINFPNRFKFLNFLSKVFSYLIKKTFGIK